MDRLLPITAIVMAISGILAASYMMGLAERHPDAASLHAITIARANMMIQQATVWALLAVAAVIWIRK